jgi:hypothetical protein
MWTDSRGARDRAEDGGVALVEGLRCLAKRPSVEAEHADAGSGKRTDVACEAASIHGTVLEGS